MARLGYFLLCDAAIRTSGKMNALGIFNTICVGSVPTLHPHLALLAEILDEPGEHTFQFHFKASDETDIIPASPEGKFRIGEMGFQEVVIEIGNLPLRQEGFLSVEIWVDGKKLGQRDLMVRKLALPST
ncbi:MAG: hypothetical protein HYZ53_05455 [Planctomycetes bacterium]|nr:hypothetical protein [Planctomycetota bacterium]